MPESPDFDQIAERWCFNEDTDTVPEMEARRTEFVAVLRSIWNARGAADAHAVSIRSMELLGTAGGGVYAEHYEKTIKKLDR